MKRTPLLYSLAVALLAFSQFAFALPPFKQGEIVVEGGVSGYEVIKQLPASNLTVVKAPKGKELAEIKQLRKKGRRAGLNFIAQASKSPNDPLYGYQWHMPRIQSEKAWDVTLGNNVKVAVLDTGIVRNGADGINECTSGAYDVVNLDSDPSDGSSLSHGTHVAGTIAQHTSFDAGAPGAGVVGIAPQACVMVVKVLNDSGSGSFADIAEGIYRAVNAGARVINMSLGVNARYGITSDPLIDPALDYAEANNVLVVAAAGNDGNRKNVSYPAIYPSVVAVGATDFNDNVVRYSNRGTGLDMMAPGGDTAVDLNGDGYPDGVLQETRYNGAFGYYFLQGTSMASPHVAGVGALVVANGAGSVQQVRDALLATARDLGSAGYDNTYGHGLVQAFNALNNGGTPSVEPPGAPTDPSPADLAVDVATTTQLSWFPADGATSYKVYLGTDVLALKGTTSQTSYDPGTLQENTLYQWQIEAVNDNGSTFGPVWYFTTAASGGTCTDADGDGYCAEVDDCNDNDANVYPGHQDTKGRWGRDGVDNDCDGVIDF